MPNFPTHTALSILTAGLLLGGARIFTHSPASPAAPSPAPAIAPEPSPKITAPSPLLADGGGALDHFYQALRRTEKGEPGAVTRIVHYGDSPTTADLITGDTRRLLQKQFGDAGHGFILIAKPWNWYQHA